MVKQDKYWPSQAAWLLGLPSGAVTGAVKRRGYWVCQAAWLLGLPSGAVTGSVKRRGYWVCQAAPLLGPPSGVIAGPAKRRRYWVRQAAWLLGPPSGAVTGPAAWGKGPQLPSSVRCNTAAGSSSLCCSLSAPTATRVRWCGRGRLPGRKAKVRPVFSRLA